MTFNSSSERLISLLFGGLLDRCTLDRRAEVLLLNYKNNSLSHINGVSYFKVISNIDTSRISSGPVRLCLCLMDNGPNCSNSSLRIRVMKGELFNISLVAVDQVNKTVNNVMVHSLLKYTESGFNPGQLTQMTRHDCTKLQFNIFSPHRFEELTLYPEGPCRNSSRSQLRVNIIFLPCNCPIIGFAPKQNESTTCDCICDPRMSPYIVGDDCDYQSRSLTRRSKFWISYVTHYAGNFSGFVIYPHCPFDYCQKDKIIHINLNRGNGIDDTLCAYNRSGILCGKCLPGLSLSLGSSKCLLCSKSWYKMFSAILIAALLAGVVLVVVLMTVATGTLNGITFYANVLGATSGTGLSNRIPSILISWLNLEIGFDVCFFEGMDTYWKTWLQLAFPSYVILLVILIIVVSEHSVRFSQLIARKNPVVTLGTLILLSYTTILQTTITALALAKVKYPDGSSQWGWFTDAVCQKQTHCTHCRSYYHPHVGCGLHISSLLLAVDPSSTKHNPFQVG